MQARKWNLNKDYSTLCEWCKKYNWDTAFPEGILPPKGIIVEDKKLIICAAGLHVDKGSKLGFMYGIFSNPDINKVKLFKAMKLCVNEIYKLAKKCNLDLVYTMTGEKALHKLYENHLKMKLCEKNLKSYVINLKEKKYTNFDWIAYE